MIYSEHAEQNLLDRKLDRRWVEQTVSFPDLILPHEDDRTLEHYYKRIAEHGNRVLHVIFNRNESRVVTAYFDRSMKGRL